VHGQAHREAPSPSPTTIDAAVNDAAARVIDDRGRRQWTRGDTGRAVIAVGILVGSGIAASKGVAHAEAQLFELVNGLPDVLYPVVWPVMQLGNVTVAVGVCAVAGLALRSARTVVVLTATPIVAWWAAKGVKELVQRGRPTGVGLEVHQRGLAEPGLGFISGHTTVAFAVAAALAAHLRPAWRRGALAIAGAVGLSRIYVGAHLPLDVVGGAACGLLIGEAARLVELRVTRHHRPPPVGAIARFVRATASRSS
jgi:undecaprenyl-diphosphatase